MDPVLMLIYALIDAGFRWLEFSQMDPADKEAQKQRLIQLKAQADAKTDEVLAKLQDLIDQAGGG